MRKWGGSCLQFRCDEKGYVGVCVFGLPGHTHEGNPGRGVLSALDLHSRFQKGGQRVCIGITTDNLLCTCVGGRKVRLEYTVRWKDKVIVARTGATPNLVHKPICSNMLPSQVFGDAINLSARLMMKCKDRQVESDILCDESTRARCGSQAEFEALDPITVKVGGGGSCSSWWGSLENRYQWSSLHCHPLPLTSPSTDSLRGNKTSL